MSYTNFLNNKAIEFITKDDTSDWDTYITTVQLKNGKIGVFKVKEAGKVVAACNSEGFSDVLPGGNNVAQIIGIKPVTEDRTLESVVKHFADQIGEENVFSQTIL